MPEQDKDRITGESKDTSSSDAAISARLGQIQREISGVENAPRVDGEILSPRLVPLDNQFDTHSDNSGSHVGMGFGSTGEGTSDKRQNRTKIASRALKELRAA